MAAIRHYSRSRLTLPGFGAEILLVPVPYSGSACDVNLVGTQYRDQPGC